MTSTTRAAFRVLTVGAVIGVGGLAAGSVLVGEGRSRAHARPTIPALAERDRSGPTRHEAWIAALESSPSPAPLTTASISVAESTPTAVDCRPVFEGLVVDPAGAPIRDATIEGRDEAWNVVTSVTSNADGSFRISTVLPMSLMARAPGFVDGVQCDSRVEPSNGVAMLVPLVLRRAATVLGLVTHRGRPVAEARVRLDRWGQCTAEAQELTTDRDGRFEVTGCLQGDYTVSASVAGTPRRCSTTPRFLLAESATKEVNLALLDVRGDLAISVHMADGRAPTSPRRFSRRSVLVGDDLLIVDDDRGRWAPLDRACDVVVNRGALVGRARVAMGQRTVDVLLEPEVALEGWVRSSIGAPSPDAWVSFVVDGRDRATEPVETAADGHFAFDVPRDLSGTLIVQLDGGLAIEQTVSVGETTVQITLPPTGHLRVELMPRPRTMGAFITATSAHGQRRLHDRAPSVHLEPGRTKIVGYDPERGRVGVTWVDVIAGATVDVTLALAPGGRVRGRVVDPHGRPVQAELALEDQRNKTDASGRFSFTLVPLGQHTLAAASDLDLVAARFGAKRATLRERIIDVTRPEELDLGDLVVEVE